MALVCLDYWTSVVYESLTDTTQYQYCEVYDDTSQYLSKNTRLFLLADCF
mgnify:CR=1 FL=1